MMISNCVSALNDIVIGKSEIVETAFATLLARGSVLIEDRPGFGKTTLAKSLARVLGLSFQRIQCTNDLLPMDILGRLDFSASKKGELIKGPIFASVVLLDELNRAPARTQSAFLQAMEEGEITLEGQTFELPRPQMFIATQNPSDQIGTTLLPESELDRFTTRVSLGPPDIESEKTILTTDVSKRIDALKPLLSGEQLVGVQNQVAELKASDEILNVIARFLAFARSKGAMLSPRAGRDILRVARAFAFIHQQPNVLPEDVKRALRFVIEHRCQDAHALIANFSFQA